MSEVKQKKPFYKRWWFLVIAGLIVIGMLGNLFESDESKQAKKDEEIAVQKEKEDKKAAKEEAKKQAEEIRKEKEQKEKERIANLTLDQKIVENNDAVDEADFTDGLLTLKSEITSFWDETDILESDVYDLFDIMVKAFKDKQVKQVDIVLSTGMVDNKGNESIDEIVKYSYSRASFEELNVEKFKDLAFSQTWRIFNESDTYWIHPGIYKNVKSDYKKNLQYGIAKQ